MYRLCFAALVLLCQYGCAGTVTFDGAAIERMYHLFKTDPQFFIFVKHCGFLNQSHRKVLINIRQSFFSLASASVDLGITLMPNL